MAKKNFLIDIDLNQNALLNAKIQNQSSAPSTPVLGQIYFDTTLDQFGVYTASSWVYLDAGNINDILGDNTSSIQVSITNNVATISQLAATSAQNGYMSSSDKSKLDNATPNATGNTIVERNSTGGIDVNQISIINTPVNQTDGVNKQYVDGVAQGLSIKEPVRVIASINKVLSGLQTIDGISLVDGDRVLVALQTDPTQDGIYIVRSTAWDRADDFKLADSVANAFMFVSEGNTYADTGWVCTNDKPNDIVGTDNLIFVQFSAAGVVEAGAGLIKTGNNIDVVAGDTSVTVNPNDIVVKRANDGAVGLDVNGIRTNVDGDRITIVANQLTTGNHTSRIASAAVTIGDIAGPATITHNFGTRNLVVQVFDATSYEQLGVEIVHTNTNNITVSSNGTNRNVIVVITGNIGQTI